MFQVRLWSCDPQLFVRCNFPTRFLTLQNCLNWIPSLSTDSASCGCGGSFHLLRVCSVRISIILNGIIRTVCHPCAGINRLLSWKHGQVWSGFLLVVHDLSGFALHEFWGPLPSWNGSWNNGRGFDTLPRGSLRTLQVGNLSFHHLSFPYSLSLF